MFRIDIGELSCVSCLSLTALDEWVRGSKEFLEDLIVGSHVHVAEEFILALGDTVLETVFTILVIDAFLEWVRQNFISLA